MTLLLIFLAYNGGLLFPKICANLWNVMIGSVFIFLAGIRPDFITTVLVSAMFQLWSGHTINPRVPLLHVHTGHATGGPTISALALAHAHSHGSKGEIRIALYSHTIYPAKEHPMWATGREVFQLQFWPVLCFAFCFQLFFIFVFIIFQKRG